MRMTRKMEIRMKIRTKMKMKMEMKRDKMWRRIVPSVAIMSELIIAGSNTLHITHHLHIKPRI
jgi:uncharacterized membrane protein SirB2